MKLMSYMLKKFTGIFVGSMLFFIMILELVNLFANIWGYISRNVPVVEVSRIMLYYMPRCVWYAVPMSMLFATAYMLSDLYAKNELLAVFASGVSLFKFTFPLLIISIVMSFALFLFEDNVVVQSETKFNQLQNKVLHKEKSLNNDKIVIISDEGKIIYNSEFYDNELSRLYTLFIVMRNDDMEFERVLYAESALWNPEESYWQLSSSKMYIKDGDEYIARSVPHDVEVLLNEPPETFQNNTVSVTEVSSKVAKEYIEHLEKSGLPSAEAKSEYYKKFAFPFVVFIVVFLAIGLSGKTRKNVLLISLALSIAAVVVFYVTQMVTMLMAKFGTIPPVMGEWFPIMLFTLISIVLLKYART